MREMKDSGIEWIGEIPSNWKLSKIGHLYRLKNVKVNDTSYPPLSVTNKGILPQLDTVAKTNAHDDRKLVNTGDFVINSRSDRRGSCGISSYDGSVSLINIVLSPLAKMEPTYFDWLFHTTQFGEEFYKWGHGIVNDLWTTNWQDMKKISISLPPAFDQTRIANFLDSKCAEIDALTADIQAEIDILEQYKKSVITEAVTKGLDPNVEMKDSGIFYLGKINKSWRITKLGYICNKLSRSFNADDPALICTNKGTVTERGDKVVGLMSSDDNAMQGIRVGDIAIHGMDTWHGAIALSKLDGKITRVVHVCESTEDNRYIVYFLQSLAFRDVYKLISNGVRGNTSDFRSWDKAKDICIALPSYEEQTRISDYLDKICTETTEIIKVKSQQLTVLANYKKSLIYEYVTGKKEVPTTNTNAVITVDPQVILLGGIVRRIGKSQHGRTQLQKLLYLCNTHLGLNLNIQYYRYEHGPYDVHLNDYIHELVKNQWFNEKKQDKKCVLVSGKKWEEFEQNHPNPFGEKKQEIGKLFKQLKDLSTRQIERIATLYAAWNDFLLDGITPSDDQIIQDVVTNWTENKAHFQYTTWQESLNQMKQYGLIPKGTGLHTLPKP